MEERDEAQTALDQIKADVKRELLADKDFTDRLAESTAPLVTSLSIDHISKAAERNQAKIATTLQEGRAKLQEQAKNGQTPAASTPQSPDEWKLLLMQNIAKLLDVDKDLELFDKGLTIWNKAKHPALDAANLPRVSLSTIRAIAAQHPDEFAFVANQVLPDPMNEVIPSLTEDAYKRGFQSRQEAERWAREYVRENTLAERRLRDSSSSGTRTVRSTEPTPESKPSSEGRPAPQPAEMHDAPGRKGKAWWDAI